MKRRGRRGGRGASGAAGATGGARYDYGAADLALGASAVYWTPGGSPGTVGATVRSHCVDGPRTCTKIAIACTVGVGATGIYRIEIYKAIPPAAPIATGSYVDMPVTYAGGVLTLSAPIAFAEGNLISLTSRLLSGTVSTAPRNVTASAIYEEP